MGSKYNGERFGMSWKLSLETRQRMSKAQKGRKITWGNKISKSVKQAIVEGRFHRNLRCVNCGQFYYKEHFCKPVSIETKQKMSIAHKGQTYTSEQIERYKLSKIGSKNPMYGKKQSREFIRKRFQHREISKLELKFQNIVNRLRLSYRFVGNGSFFIERKNPDFVNTNGEKIAIEVFYRKHKELYSKGLERWKNERVEIFRNYGWKVEFFDETQVNEEEIKRRIG